MNGTSGRLFEIPFATYDPASSSWRTSGRIYRSDSGTYSATWPDSGSMQNGECFEHPTWERRIREPGSSLLPTPMAREYKGPNIEHTNLTAVLLPTPRASDRNGTSVPHGDGGLDLRTTVERLLPTPTARDGNHGGPQSARYLNPDRSNDLDDAIHALSEGLLPTPTSRDWKGENQRKDERCLPGAILRLPEIGDGSPALSDDGKP